MTLVSARFVRFVLVGAVGTAAHWSVLMLLVGQGVGPVVASVAGFVVGGLVNYGTNRVLVFGAGRRHVEALPRFFTVAGLGLLWNALLMALATGPLGLPVLPSQVVTTGILVFWHYLANAAWTFRSARG